MPTFKLRYFSIVFIGKQNPQILNHDFLLINKVLPEDQEPFIKLLSRKDQEPFSEFICTPVLSSIKYDAISIVVDENRFQIRDEDCVNPATSPIITIIKKYFGELLRYTPLKLGGININGSIQFENMEDEKSFDNRIGIDKIPLISLTGTEDIRIGSISTFPWNDGVNELRLSKPKDRAQPAEINFNYEFTYHDIDSFMESLDNVEQLHSELDRFLKLWHVTDGS